MITFDNTEFDLGTINYGETKSVDVNITNSGSTEVTLKTSNASCSCTTGHLEYSTLQPNSKGKFTIIFNSNKSGKGESARSINLDYSINRKSFNHTFRVKANVI